MKRGIREQMTVGTSARGLRELAATPPISETTMFKAIAIGAVSAVVLGFVLAAGYGAVLGARVPWGDVQMGSAGAGNALNNMVFPPILLAVAGIGALIG